MSQVEFVDADRVADLISMPEAIGAVREAVIGLSRGEFEMPVRSQLRDGSFLFMPCHHRASGSATLKMLSVDFARDPSIVGSLLWLEEGRVEQLVIDAGAVTALRTGAITGVATDLLASPSASACTLFGTGAQARNQVRAVHAVRPLSRLTVVGQTPARSDEFAKRMGAELGLAESAASDDVHAALRGADIVCCATNARAPLFQLSSLAESVHVNAIGAYRPEMRELSDEVLASGLLVVDERNASLEESGEVIHAIASGHIRAADLVELGHALTSGVKRTPRTLFKSVGLSVQDWAVAAALARKVLV